ncbi:hypothetical protein PTTG_02536 [Puccinia triticina 1-1 BBBD Race 1]|uniref:Zn(2)-C6 fungal-type domain-containing protein n=1 Tax=Puccinia triticina (isolate 1-1 / race 1 (BBBD)) TaxID=630390 RepID=A0A180GJW7_PUCT1|nr:hypothetical protein PTTG_02536 [Puccinia triticina 1-1 BBBD Race 1]
MADPDQSHILQMKPLPTAEPPKRVRQRTLRACDRCRKMKVKCMISADEPPCDACKLASRDCKFEHVGVKRERPPSLREVEQQKRQIAQLEAVLIRLKPQIDLSSLPRTNDQAKTMANALQHATSSEALRLNHPTSLGPGHDTDSQHYNNHEEIEEDSEEEDEDDDEEDEEEDFQNMLQSLGECQLGSCQLLDQSKDPSSSHEHDRAHPFEAPDPADQDPDDQNATFIRQFCQNYYRGMSDETWPAEDLAEKLIATYFETVHPYPPIIHEHQFRKDYHAGMAERDSGFKSLCYAVFAAASPHADDPRVLYAAHSDNPHPRQSAGALFAYASLAGDTNYPLFDLFGLQSAAIMSYYMMTMSNPRHTFALVVEFLRRAVSSGVHLEESPRWNTSFLTNQLRKRAFFTLITVEKSTTSTLGYLNVPQTLPNLVSPPFFIEDATMSLLDEQDRMQPTPQARKQFMDELYSKPRTPGEAAMYSLWSARNKLESKSRNMILNQLKAQSPPSSSSKADDGPGSNTKNNRHLFILNFGTVLGDFIEDEMDPMGRWNPSLTSKRDLFATSYCACFLRSILIRVHLEAISGYPQLAHRCFRAASSILDTLDDMKLLGHLSLLGGNIPYFLAPVGLFLLWVISQDKSPVITADFKANAWVKISKCVEILNLSAPVSFVSEKLSLKFTAYMDHLKEEIRNPGMDTSISADTSKKRPLSEIMAKKVEEPTICNLLYSQHASPVNPDSYLDPVQPPPPAYINFDFSGLINTAATPQPSGWNLDATRPAAPAGNLNPAIQPHAPEPASNYSHLHLQNLLFQSQNLPQQPLDSSHLMIPPSPENASANRPRPVNSDGPSHPSPMLGRFDPPDPRSSFLSSTPSAPHSIVATDPEMYTGANGGIPPQSSGTQYMKPAAHDSFDPNFCSVGNPSTQNVETSFPSGSDFAPTGFAGSEPIFNVHQRILAANHPANYYGHPARPAGPSHPGYNAVQPAGPSGYAPHPMAYHPSARPPPGPTAFTQPYPDGRPCADFPAPAGSFPAFSPSSSPATPRPFHPSSSTDPSQCNRPVQGTIGNSFHGSAPAQPLPSTLATSQNGSFDTSGQFRGPAQHDDQQIFSAICDTWLF